MSYTEIPGFSSALLLSVKVGHRLRRCYYFDVSIRSHVAIDTISSHGTRGKRLAAHMPFRCSPNLSELDLTFCHPPKPCPLNERDDEPFTALEDDALSILRSEPRIVTLSLANWPSNAARYHRTLRTLCLAASFSVPPAEPHSPTPLCPLNRTPEPSLTLVREEARACGRLKGTSVVLWCGDEDERAAVSYEPGVSFCCLLAARYSSFHIDGALFQKALIWRGQ